MFAGASCSILVSLIFSHTHSPLFASCTGTVHVSAMHEHWIVPRLASDRHNVGFRVYARGEPALAFAIAAFDIAWSNEPAYWRIAADANWYTRTRFLWQFSF